jgi:hypothetical protein
MVRNTYWLVTLPDRSFLRSAILFVEDPPVDPEPRDS